MASPFTQPASGTCVSCARVLAGDRQTPGWRTASLPGVPGVAAAILLLTLSSDVSVIYQEFASCHGLGKDLFVERLRAWSYRAVSESPAADEEPDIRGPPGVGTPAPSRASALFAGHHWKLFQYARSVA